MCRTKKIKIVNISRSYYWYKDKLNSVLDVIREDKDYYWCKEDAGYLNIVIKSDAEIYQKEGGSINDIKC